MPPVITTTDVDRAAADVFAVTCSGRVAPVITEATDGWASSHATASSVTVWPRSART